MKPLFKWSGGKTKEIEIFKKYYPTFKTFIEPFFGAGAVFFDMENYESNIINDIHPESINFLEQIKIGNSKRIYDLMNVFKNDEETYYFIRDNFKPKNKVEEAFVFLYLRKTCFRGMLRYNKSGKFNIPFGRYKTINFENLLDEKYELLLKNTQIYNTDFQYIFENFNNEENFMFLDPPYDSDFTDYGYCSFGREQQVRLFENFKRTKNKCLLVIGKTDFICNLYKDYIKEEYHKKYLFKLYDGRIGDEIDNYHLIITNY
jgi:DNA adenine methylase